MSKRTKLAILGGEIREITSCMLPRGVLAPPKRVKVRGGGSDDSNLCGDLVTSSRLLSSESAHLIFPVERLVSGSGQGSQSVVS